MVEVPSWVMVSIGGVIGLLLVIISAQYNNNRTLRLEYEVLRSNNHSLVKEKDNISCLLNEATETIQDDIKVIQKAGTDIAALEKENKQLKEKLEYNQNKMYSNIDTTLEQVTAIRKKLDDMTWKSGGSVYYE